MDCELIAFAVTKLHIDFVSAIKVDKGNQSVQFGPRGEVTSMNFGMNFGAHKDNERQFQMTLGVKFSEQTKEKTPLGYQVEANVIGILMVSKEVPVEKISHIVQLNGVNLLYGTMRGVIFNATGSFIVGPMMIKSLTAQEILGTLAKPPPPVPETPVVAESKPKDTKRAARNRRSPAQEGVASAQRVLAALDKRDDPKVAKKR
jgi:preprotein translocase subunit SecB